MILRFSSTSEALRPLVPISNASSVLCKLNHSMFGIPDRLRWGMPCFIVQYPAGKAKHYFTKCPKKTDTKRVPYKAHPCFLRSDRRFILRRTGPASIPRRFIARNISGNRHENRKCNLQFTVRTCKMVVFRSMNQYHEGTLEFQNGGYQHDIRRYACHTFLRGTV